ncbi:hypothetical protein Y032_0016g3049 [Ancylostoma ceylanicum]|uniref:Uncharacterized protein n=1 Tax=Ancylostoma ceylanicum TaxID=53326 RepID=A0A016V5M7_9BILA|nr:hypothetical protein Y032_0016g3049 [Ancylostoma ceylanicum]
MKKKSTDRRCCVRQGFFWSDYNCRCTEREAVKKYAATRPRCTLILLESACSFKFDAMNDIGGHLLTVHRIK